MARVHTVLIMLVGCGQPPVEGDAATSPVHSDGAVTTWTADTLRTTSGMELGGSGGGSGWESGTTALGDGTADGGDSGDDGGWTASGGNDSDTGADVDTTDSTGVESETTPGQKTTACPHGAQGCPCDPSTSACQIGSVCVASICEPWEPPSDPCWDDLVSVDAAGGAGACFMAYQDAHGPTCTDVKGGTYPKDLCETNGGWWWPGTCLSAYGSGEQLVDWSMWDLEFEWYGTSSVTCVSHGWRAERIHALNRLSRSNLRGAFPDDWWPNPDKCSIGPWTC